MTTTTIRKKEALAWTIHEAATAIAAVGQDATTVPRTKSRSTRTTTTTTTNQTLPKLRASPVGVAGRRRVLQYFSPNKNNNKHNNNHNNNLNKNHKDTNDDNKENRYPNEWTTQQKSHTPTKSFFHNSNKNNKNYNPKPPTTMTATAATTATTTVAASTITADRIAPSWASRRHPPTKVNYRHSYQPPSQQQQYPPKHPHEQPRRQQRQSLSGGPVTTQASSSSWSSSWSQALAMSSHAQKPSQPSFCNTNPWMSSPADLDKLLSPTEVFHNAMKNDANHHRDGWTSPSSSSSAFSALSQPKPKDQRPKPTWIQTHHSLPLKLLGTRTPATTATPSSATTATPSSATTATPTIANSKPSAVVNDASHVASNPTSLAANNHQRSNGKDNTTKTIPNKATRNKNDASHCSGPAALARQNDESNHNRAADDADTDKIYQQMQSVQRNLRKAVHALVAVRARSEAAASSYEDTTNTASWSPPPPTPKATRRSEPNHGRHSTSYQWSSPSNNNKLSCGHAASNDLRKEISVVQGAIAMAKERMDELCTDYWQQQQNATLHPTTTDDVSNHSTRDLPEEPQSQSNGAQKEHLNDTTTDKGSLAKSQPRVQKAVMADPFKAIDSTTTDEADEKQGTQCTGIVAVASTDDAYLKDQLTLLNTQMATLQIERETLVKANKSLVATVQALWQDHQQMNELLQQQHQHQAENHKPKWGRGTSVASVELFVEHTKITLCSDERVELSKAVKSLTATLTCLMEERDRIGQELHRTREQLQQVEQARSHLAAHNRRWSQHCQATEAKLHTVTLDGKLIAAHGRVVSSSLNLVRHELSAAKKRIVQLERTIQTLRESSSASGSAKQATMSTADGVTTTKHKNNHQAFAADKGAAVLNKSFRLDTDDDDDDDEDAFQQLMTTTTTTSTTATR